ncbi:MAG: tripartite tricarboxylate transporter substrate binding protein [Alcaligenaceae bacterium]
MSQTNKFNRLLLSAALVLLASAGLPVCAAYPERPITLVVTYPPGGTADLVARLLAPEVAKELGQNVVVENRGGAGGMIGGALVAKAAPDGYTIMLDAANHAQNPAVQPKMLFDTLKDFAPITYVQRVPNILVVRSDNEIQTVADLIRLGTQKEPLLYYASSGPGGAQHLAGVLFNALTGTHLEAVHYKGGSAGIMDVLSGQVTMMFSTIGVSLPHARAGKLRVIAVGSDKRTSAFPDIPTIAEAGVPGYASYEWNGVYAPAGTPPAIIQRLNQAFVSALKQPTVIARIGEFNGEIIASTPEELDAFRRAELDKWQLVAKKFNLQLTQ